MRTGRNLIKLSQDSKTTSRKVADKHTTSLSGWEATNWRKNHRHLCVTLLEQRDVIKVLVKVLVRSIKKV